MLLVSASYMKNTIQKPYAFTKTQQRILCERLEHFYAEQLQAWRRLELNTFLTPTKRAIAERKYRSRLKSCEILLAYLGSELFKDGKAPSIRQTTKIEGANLRVISHKRP